MKLIKNKTMKLQKNKTIKLLKNKTIKLQKNKILSIKSQIGGSLLLELKEKHSSSDDILKLIDKLKTYSENDRFDIVINKPLTLNNEIRNMSLLSNEIVIFIKKNKPKNINIHSLYFGNEDIIKILIACFTNLVVELEINDIRLPDEIIDTLQTKMQSNILKKLTLEYIDLSENMFIFILDLLKKNKSLTYLNISFSKITDEQLKLIGESLLVNNTLQTLKCLGSDVTGEGIENFTEIIENNKSLTVFHAFNFKTIYLLRSGKLYELLQRNNKIFLILNNLFRGNELNDINDENYEKYKLFFEFIKKTLQFKESTSTKDELFENHAIQLCKDMKKFYFLLAHNYQKGLLGFKSISNIENSSKKQKICLLHLHGIILNRLFKLPNVDEDGVDVDVVYISPVKYMTCLTSNITMKFIEDNITNFLKNPSCFGKGLKNNILNQAIIYRAGQYCIDLELARREYKSTNKEPEHVTGLHILINGKFEEFKIHEENQSKKLKNLSKDEYRSTLSELLKHFTREKYKDEKITIFITSCRELNDDDYTAGLDNLFSFYENIIKITNFVVQDEKCLTRDDCSKEYETCKTIDTLNNYSLTLKVNGLQKYRTTNAKTTTISSRFKAKITDEFKLCFTDEILQIKLKYIYLILKISNNTLKKSNCITIGSLKDFIKSHNLPKSIKFLDLSILLAFYSNVKISHPSIKNSILLFSSAINYNNIILFIFDNDVNELFKYKLFYEYNSTKSEIINFFIKLNHTKLSDELRLNNYGIETPSQLLSFNYSLDSNNKLNYRIRILDLSNNKAKDFFSVPTNSLELIQDLEEINLDNNELTRFPTELLKLQKLKLISLKGNTIKIKPENINQRIQIIY